ncbi:hypothetical protein NQ314_005948 [Rhamnusium bicolor]|uniref:Uncharacterized protein n=1 Tax=Rhamnusium bicolor TaxID=1586634 RepID=A0AAV8ZBT0_9CUCU|nr:hypothetical protein NQ314_005948 [Rhamnusium bicolor]
MPFCILHNFVRKYDGVTFQDELYECDLINMNPTAFRPTLNNIEKREYFANYFTLPSGSILGNMIKYRKKNSYVPTPCAI